MPPTSTDRLTFRELTCDDLDFVAGMLGHAEVMRHYPRTRTRAEAVEWIDRERLRYERDGHGLWLVTERASGTAVGQVGVITQNVGETPEPEVGYLLHRPFWGRGFATEAAIACRDWAFATHGAPRVISLIRAENHPSRAVAARVGMRAVSHMIHAGLDHLVYAVTAAEINGPTSDASPDVSPASPPVVEPPPPR